MCEYCENDKKIFEEKYYEPYNYSPDYRPVLIGVFIDRGHLRLCDLDDCSCLDSGEKVKINFCPFCGEKIIWE